MVYWLIFLFIIGCSNTSSHLYPKTHAYTTFSQLISKHGQVYRQDIHLRLSRIVEKLRITSNYFKVIVLNSHEVNAYAGDDNIILITLPLYELAKNDDELAFIIAHELGHLMLHKNVDSSAMNRNQIVQIENQADQFAVSKLIESGFDSNNGIEVLLSENFVQCQHSSALYLSPNQRYLSLIR